MWQNIGDGVNVPGFITYVVVWQKSSTPGWVTSFSTENLPPVCLLMADCGCSHFAGAVAVVQKQRPSNR